MPRCVGACFKAVIAKFFTHTDLRSLGLKDWAITSNNGAVRSELIKVRIDWLCVYPRLF
ncbi:MAG: hypothetical protein HLUCCA11_15625 [Phormidesmis priestleyi Ana]|uniref:Uncharacterized protein n=1 Tax=Phormidesmis priestleyi Ana TaxID=1666911 RepID=A0A0P7ZMR4_9CYAN|nr:MAG: hypothetical protein HLUCCA11_15625 [Phormidesmis priestleyi Ana]